MAESDGSIEAGARGTRVAVLTRYFPPDYSGAGLQLSAVLDRLRGRGVRFLVLAAGESRAEPPADEALVVRRLAAPQAGLLGEFVFGVRAAAALIRDRDWDVLHTIDFSFHSILPFLLARLTRRPVLVKTTLLEEEGVGWGARLLRAVRGLGYGRADALVALSDAIEASLRDDFHARGRILRIPNGVDTQRFRPAEPAARAQRRRELGIPDAAFAPALCGMRIARKNSLGLVEAASRMQYRPVHLLLAGPPGEDPGYERRLRAAIAELPDGIDARVFDDLPPDEIAGILQVADAYVLPSEAEGMPNSLLEAMAAGLACIATDIPGSRDVLAGGVGRLVPLGDLPALTKQLDELAADAEGRARLGRRALDRIEAQYALERVAERYGAAYADLLG